MCHMEAYEKWSHEDVGSQGGDHLIDVQEKCAEHGVVIPGDLQKLH